VIRVVDQSMREHGQPIKGLLLALAAWPMGELNAAVQLAVLLRGVRDDRVGFATAGDFKRVIVVTAMAPAQAPGL
jgi:hypothetical protein